MNQAEQVKTGCQDSLFRRMSTILPQNSDFDALIKLAKEELEPDTTLGVPYGLGRTLSMTKDMKNPMPET